MEKYPPATLTLVGISIGVYVIGLLGWQDMVVRALLISKFIKPTLPELYSGQIWRLFTPMFLHFSIFHIVFNMLWTLEFGRLIESRQGATALILLSLAISSCSNLSQYFISGPSVFGGMSGVIYGYFGYIWIQSLINPRFGIRLNPVIVKLMLGWFVVCWSGVLEWFGISIANTAHTAGLLSGMGLAFIISGMARVSRK